MVHGSIRWVCMVGGIDDGYCSSLLGVDVVFVAAAGSKSGTCWDG